MKCNKIARGSAWLTAGVAMLLCASCRTTEENYRKAYNVTAAKRATVLTDVEEQAIARSEKLQTDVYNGDSIRVSVMYVKPLDGNSAKAGRYSTAVASFRQRFNAVSACKRLQAAGYDDAVVLEDAQGAYYVCACSTDNREDAVKAVKTLEYDSPLPLKKPFPQILKKP